jgi:hypothetical protein
MKHAHHYHSSQVSADLVWEIVRKSRCVDTVGLDMF